VHFFLANRRLKITQVYTAYALSKETKDQEIFTDSSKIPYTRV